MVEDYPLLGDYCECNFHTKLRRQSWEKGRFYFSKGGMYVVWRFFRSYMMYGGGGVGDKR